MRFETFTFRRGYRPVAVRRNRFRVGAFGRRWTRLRAHRTAQNRIERLVISIVRRHVITIPYSLNEPRPENCTVRIVSFDVRERARQIDLQIARSPIITQPNLVLAQAGRRRAASVRSRALSWSRVRASRRDTVDSCSSITRPISLSDKIVPIVIRHPHPVPRRERLERGVERLAQHRNVACALGVRARRHDRRRC